MNNRLIVCLIASLLAIGFSKAQPTPKRGTPVSGVVRVKLQADIAASLPQNGMMKAHSAATPLQVGVKTIDASLRRVGGRRMRPVFPCPKGREAEHRLYGLDRWYEIECDESVQPLEVRHILRETAGIETASVRVPMKMLEDASFRVVDDMQSTARKAPSAYPFNDPRLPKQWHYHNDGTMPNSAEGADINLFPAWKIATGSSKVIVAVIDGGIDFNHEDLSDNMWVNEAERDGEPGVDDDGNGYIDDVFGYNFCTNTGTVYPHNHGTHVAGTIGAINNNGIGVCGVAGGNGHHGSGVRLMSCQVFDGRQGSGQGDFAAAIVYAADMGATIANCSWGWDEDGYYEPDVIDAVRYFTHSARSENMTGGLLFFASGNDASTGQLYPSCMDEVVAVSAMGGDMMPASYSNYGAWVDVTAPGGYMDFNADLGVLSTLPNNQYGCNEGTSMATPHVTGIAALVLSKYGSPTLTSENLRQQIITSVNDFYTLNPQAEGLFGSGYVDAYKALQWGDGTAPSPVTDLSVAAMQESMTLTWTIPSSASGNVNNHILYYATSPFGEESLGGCKTVVIDTKFCAPGEEFTYELEHLQPLTTYYLALKAVDRWGNASPLSNVVEMRTNAGPHMTINRTSMTLYTEDGGATWPSRSFVISNTDEGLLKWSVRQRASYSAVSAFAADNGRAVPLMTVPYHGRANAMPAQKAADVTVERDLADFTQDDYPQEICNHTGVYAFIGDNELPNSMAQLFTVNKDTYPEGFNLTHIYMEGNYGKHPIIEVYSYAAALTSATLIERYDLGAEATPYYIDHALPEAIMFRPGESFYIVIHFEDYDNRNYPLGLSYYADGAQAVATQAYMSNDKGKTWSRLSEVLRGTSYEYMADESTWAITAKSKYPDWSKVLTITPSSGQLRQGEKQTVTVTHNGTPMPNGEYRARLSFDTNESEQNQLGVNVTMTVKGMQPDVVYNKVVQFGSLLVGQKKTVKIEVFNRGYGAFAGASGISPSIFSDKITSSSPHFSGPELLEDGIPARAYTSIVLTYEPKEAGNHTGVITFADNSGHTLRINVTGSAADPAHISVSPETVSVGDLDANVEAKTVDFEIANTGNYPLQFVMPKFSDETFEDISVGTSTHRFGYVWESNLYGSQDVQYSGAPDLLGAVDVSDQMGDYDYFSDPIDIGFDFPFYDKTYRQIYISKLGTLSFAPYLEGSIYSPLYETINYMAGLGVISAYGFEFEISPNSRVEYARQDGRFVVNFKDVLVTVYDTDRMPASFHIALSPSGDIEIEYDDYTAEKVFQQGSTIWVGISDPNQQDPLTVTSSSHVVQAFWYGDTSEEANRWRYINTGTRFHFIAPKPNMIVSVNPSAGIVAPGETLSVRTTLAATDDMYAGAIYNDLVIQSNDISTPAKLVRFNANIVGDLHPLFELGSDGLDFGNVFRTSSARMSVSVQNNGRDKMVLQGVAIDGSFTHDFAEAVTIPAGQSKDINVTMPTESEGAIEGTMTVTTDAGVKTVALKGTVIGVPEIQLGYTKIAETLASGDSRRMPLTVTNTGNEPLEYSVLIGSHLSYTPEYGDNPQIEYSYVSSMDDASAKREWVEIATNGLGKQYNYTTFLNRDFIAVRLPFEFTYYGKKYKDMYIYDAGFVSFTHRQDEGGIWPEPPVDFPAGSFYTNIIAPYWGLHTMDISATAGIFHYETEDMAVVSWIEYGNSMNRGVNFQLILRRDGSFTFNYRPAYDNAVIWGIFGVAGLVNADGDGINLPARYVEFDTSLNFTPIVGRTLQPGDTQNVDITLQADELAGTYRSKIELRTNIPTQPKVEIPVNLTITGTPAPVFPEDINMEYVSEYVETENVDMVHTLLGAFYYIPINIENTGTAAFTITGITKESPKHEGSDMFNLYYYGRYIDSWSGSEAEGWAPYSGQRLTVGRGTTRLVIPISMNDYSRVAWQTPGTYDIRLTFRISGVEGLASVVLPVRLTVTDQPTFAIDRDEIRLTVNDDYYVGDESFTISNSDGRYALRYTITVDPTGEGAKTEGMAKSVETPATTTGETLSREITCEPLSPATLSQGDGIRPYDVGTSENIYNCPDPYDEEFPYLRALYWPAHPTNTVAYNYGTETTYGVYKAATAFTGPEGGFNISHVYFAMNPYRLSNKDMLVEIINGDPQVDYDVIGRGTFNLGEVNTVDYQNQLYIVTLEHPVYISEGQRFYVVITFPTGQKHPAMIISKQDAVVSNRYLGFVDNYGWFDLAALFEKGYGSLGYLTTCLETVEGDAWAKMLDPTTGKTASKVRGEILPGQTQTLKVRFNAAAAPKETDNKAVLVIRTNDPKAAVTNLPVYLNKNASPTITVGGGNLLVNEGETLCLEVRVSDPEGDTVTVEIDDDADCCTITSATEGTTIDDGGKSAITSTTATFTIAIAPTQSIVGTHTLTITATDDFGHTASHNVNFTVAHVNQAPIYQPIGDVLVQTGSVSSLIDLRTLFTDPDDDAHTYTVSIANEDIVRLFRADNEIFLRGLREGQTDVTVVCTDPAGATAIGTFTVRVMDDLTGIATTSASNLGVRLSDDGSSLLISTGTAFSPVHVAVYALSGQQLLGTMLSATGTHTVSVSHLPAGTYIVRLASGADTFTAEFTRPLR